MAENLATAPQWFETDPRDDELATFIDPFQYSVSPVYVAIVETSRTIRGEPAKFPVWFAGLCVLPVLGVFIWMDLHGRIPAGPLGPLKYPFVLLASVSVPVLLALINRSIAAIPPYFILDKVSGTLELPPYGVTIASRAIRRFVEVRGWKKNERTKETDRVRELTVLVTAEDGRIARYALGIDQGAALFRRRPMSRQLADFLGVPISEIRAAKGET